MPGNAKQSNVKTITADVRCKRFQSFSVDGKTPATGCGNSPRGNWMLATDQVRCTQECLIVPEHHGREVNAHTLDEYMSRRNDPKAAFGGNAHEAIKSIWEYIFVLVVIIQKWTSCEIHPAACVGAWVRISACGNTVVQLTIQAWNL